MNRLPLTCMTLAAGLVWGCREDGAGGPPTTAQATRPATMQVLEPLHPGEIRVVTTSGGISTAGLVYRSKAGSKPIGGEGVSGRFRQWKTERASLKTNVGPGRSCLIEPTLLRNEADRDVWEFKLTFEREIDGGTATHSRTVQVVFDGKEPVKVFEDDDHNIVIGPPGSE